jgi:iron(III) transport system permease protein
MIARQTASDPLRNTTLLVTLVTSVLVIGPLCVVLLTSVHPGLPLIDGLAFTVAHYRSLLDWRALTLLANTLAFAGGSLVLGLVLGTVLAFLSERTDLPGRDVIYFALFASLVFPILVQTLGWILFLSPRIGLANLWLRALFGLNGETGPLDVYTVWGMIFVTGLGITGTTYIMLTAVMRMNPELEEAAQASGAPFFRSFRTVTLPLLAPGYLSVAIYLSMILVQVFDTPLVLGIPANFPVLSLRIYLAAHPDWGLPVYGLSAAYGVILLTLGIALLFVYLRLTRLKERFQIVGGKGFRARRVQLRRWKYPALAFVIAILALKTVPTLLLAWASLLPFYQPPSPQSLAEVSLRNYQLLFASSKTVQAVANTLILGLLVPTLTMALVTVIAWVLVRSRRARVLDIVSFVPVALPSMLVGLALLVLLVRSPIYNTVWILVLGQVMHFVGYGTRVMQPAFLQLHRDLEEAAGASGASPLHAVRTVSLPLLLNSIFNTWLWISIVSVRDLQIPLMLFSSSNIVLSVLIFQEWSAPNSSGAAAAGMILVLIVTLMFTGITLLRQRVAPVGV